MGFHRVNYTIFAALHVGFRGRFPPLLILLRLKAAITAPVFCANNIAKGLAVLYPNLQQTGFIVTCPGVCPLPLLINKRICSRLTTLYFRNGEQR